LNKACSFVQNMGFNNTTENNRKTNETLEMRFLG
jgi:hypothetical protein